MLVILNDYCPFQLPFNITISETNIPNTWIFNVGVCIMHFWHHWQLLFNHKQMHLLSCQTRIICGLPSRKLLENVLLKNLKAIVVENDFLSTKIIQIELTGIVIRNLFIIQRKSFINFSPSSIMLYGDDDVK